MLQLLLLIFSFSLFAQDLENLASKPKWHKLLHYKKTLTGLESEADGRDFFLAVDGKTNPVAELRASIEQFQKTARPVDGDPACRFPLRLKWLNQELGYPWKVDLSHCTKYLEFFSKVAARRASIVFSSYYLSNPNSAFGHTFLRLSRFEDRDETEMLDYGINYAAEARATNPFSYAIKGLFGGFPGRFAAIPYYYKVREYSDFEFRDLWSYELNLTTPQVLEMVDHIWELAHTYFDYYYFLENCSYHLLSVIDVVLPEKNLTSNYNVFTIPADTIRLLKKEGLISEGKRRESTYSRLLKFSEGKSAKELELAKDLAKNPKAAQPTMDSRVLDVAIEAFDYYQAPEILMDDAKARELKFPLLKARAQNPTITEWKPSTSGIKDSPAESHAPTRLSLSQGTTHQEGQFTKLEWRAALHDLLDPPQGSLKDARLEMGRLSFNYREIDYQKKQVVLEELSFLDLRNYPPQNFWASHLSWEVMAGLQRLDTISCSDCPAPVIMASVGNALTLFQERVLLALLINTEFNLHQLFRENYQWNLGPILVSRLSLSENWMMGLSTSYHYQTYEITRPFTDQAWRGEFELRRHFGTAASLFLRL